MKQTKTIFWVNWGTFYGNTMVCCGWKDYTEVKSFLKKKKFVEWHDALAIKPDEYKTNHFGRWTLENVKTGKERHFSLLWLLDWKEDLEHMKVLAHELVHAVMFCMPDFLDIQKEHEAVAYQHSYLFKSIVEELRKN